MNIIDWLLSEKIATHWKQAQNIIVGLELNKLYIANDYDEIKCRARLYRDIRNSGENSKRAFEISVSAVHCPVCPDIGEYMEGETDDPIQVQCEFCNTTPNSYYNLRNIATMFKGVLHSEVLQDLANHG